MGHPLRRPTLGPARATALVVVLAVLVLVTTALTTAATQAGRLAAARSRGEARAALDDLTAEAERIAAAWLKRAGTSVTLPPDVREPRVDVLHDAWSVDGRRWSLRLTAWDQSGMVPLGALTRTTSARTGASVAAALPPGLGGAAAELGAVRPPRGTAVGLDQVRLDAAAAAMGARVYPDPDAPRLDPGAWSDPRAGDDEAAHPAATAFSAAAGAATGEPGPTWFAAWGQLAGPDRPAADRLDRPDRGASGRAFDGTAPAIGALVATHAPAGRPRINVATAPAALVAAACSAAGLDADRADAILRARADGVSPAAIAASAAAPAEDPAMRGADGDASGAGDRRSRGIGGRVSGASRDRASARRGRGAPVELVTTSGVWAFRVDVACGDLRRSWWMVFQRSSDRAGRATWRKVQQLAIDA